MCQEKVTNKYKKRPGKAPIKKVFEKGFTVGVSLDAGVLGGLTVHHLAEEVWVNRARAGGVAPDRKAWAEIQELPKFAKFSSSENVGVTQFPTPRSIPKQRLW